MGLISRVSSRTYRQKKKPSLTMSKEFLEQAKGLAMFASHDAVPAPKIPTQPSKRLTQNDKQHQLATNLTKNRKRVAAEKEDKPEKKEKTSWSTYKNKTEGDNEVDGDKKKKEPEKEETLVIKVPFPNEKGCTIAYNSLIADHPPKNSSIFRTLKISDNNELVCELRANNKKNL